MLKKLDDVSSGSAAGAATFPPKEPPVRYRRARSKFARAHGEGVARNVRDRLFTPLIGSRPIFPRYFDAAVRRLLRGDRSIDVPPSYAREYYGDALLFEVDPARLTERVADYVEAGRGPRWMGASFVDGADWTSVVARLARSPIHIEMHELIAADLAFRDTERYRLQVGRVRRGRPIYRNGVALSSVADIDAYYAYCVDLIKSVRDHGLIRRDRLSALGRSRLKHRFVRPTAVDAVERDIGVAVTPAGELIRHLGGKHRTAIAQALGLARAPVELRLAHVRWLADGMERTDLAPHLALAEGARAAAAAFAPGAPLRPTDASARFAQEARG